MRSDTARQWLLQLQVLLCVTVLVFTATSNGATRINGETLNTTVICPPHYYVNVTALANSTSQVSQNTTSELCVRCSRGPCPSDMYEVHACNATHDRVCELFPFLQPLDCEVGPWSDLSTCNATCSVQGIQFRVRNVTQATRGTGAACPSLIEVVACERSEGCTTCDLDGHPGEECDPTLNPCISDPCQNGGTCTNVFECVCTQGNCASSVQCEENGSNRSCTSCVQGFSGADCEEPCDGINTHCSVLSNLTCHQESSTTIVDCTSCDSGWFGTNCTQPCPGISSCIEGACNQLDGSDLMCTACEPGFWGSNCSQVCEIVGCQDGHTICNQTSGAVEQCTNCTQGLLGDTCTIDVNECNFEIDDPRYPCHSTRGICTNTFGSYECSCRPGYAGDGAVCVDVDECLSTNVSTTLCPTNSQCTNTVGGYACECDEGYHPSSTDPHDPQCTALPCDFECQNDGECVNGLCVCSLGYSGALCEVEECISPYECNGFSNVDCLPVHQDVQTTLFEGNVTLCGVVQNCTGDECCFSHCYETRTFPVLPDGTLLSTGSYGDGILSLDSDSTYSRPGMLEHFQLNDTSDPTPRAMPVDRGTLLLTFQITDAAQMGSIVTYTGSDGRDLLKVEFVRDETVFLTPTKLSVMLNVTVLSRLATPHRLTTYPIATVVEMNTWQFFAFQFNSTHLTCTQNGVHISVQQLQGVLALEFTSTFTTGASQYGDGSDGSAIVLYEPLSYIIFGQLIQHAPVYNLLALATPTPGSTAVNPPNFDGSGGMLLDSALNHGSVFTVSAQFEMAPRLDSFFLYSRVDPKNPSVLLTGVYISRSSSLVIFYYHTTQSFLAHPDFPLTLIISTNPLDGLIKMSIALNSDTVTFMFDAQSPREFKLDGPVTTQAGVYTIGTFDGNTLSLIGTMNYFRFAYVAVDKHLEHDSLLLS
eukprot:m.36951 g.36951  ORF g.36951 m.36951 type:complete len:930 (-) comp10056_c1_seq1:391-3180(-)